MPRVSGLVSSSIQSHSPCSKPHFAPSYHPAPSTTPLHPHTITCPAAIGKILNDILRRNAAPGAPAVQVLNNLDWFGGMSFLGFLRDVGKFARVGTMLSKDSVSSWGDPGGWVCQQQAMGAGGVCVLHLPFCLLKQDIPCCLSSTYLARMPVWACCGDHVQLLGAYMLLLMPLLLRVPCCRCAPAWRVSRASPSRSSPTSCCRATTLCTCARSMACVCR